MNWKINNFAILLTSATTTTTATTYINRKTEPNSMNSTMSDPSPRTIHGLTAAGDCDWINSRKTETVSSDRNRSLKLSQRRLSTQLRMINDNSFKIDMWLVAVYYIRKFYTVNQYNLCSKISLNYIFCSALGLHTCYIFTYCWKYIFNS